MAADFELLAALRKLQKGTRGVACTPSQTEEQPAHDEIFCVETGTIVGVLRDDGGDIDDALSYPVTAGQRLPYEFRLIGTSTDVELILVRGPA